MRNKQHANLIDASKRRIPGVALALLLVLGVAAPASADYIEESGYRACGIQQVKIRSNSWGWTHHFRNATELYVTWYNGYFRDRYSSTLEHETEWAVLADLGLNSTLTYSYCGPMPE